jgi:cytoskeletal protein CcmA (bactofilin family)
MTQSTSSFETVIGENMVFRGNVETDKSVRVDGNVIGPIHVGDRLVSSHTSRIEGQVTGSIVEIGGVVIGNIEAQTVVLLSTANIAGDVKCQKLQIEIGAFIDGKVLTELNVSTAHGSRLDI